MEYPMATDPAELFKVLGVETRVRIIELMKSEGPLGAKRIAELVGITPAAASQHLKILKQAGFVRSERNGYWIPYSIDEEALEQCGDALREICTCGCKGTGKFKEVDRNQSNLESLRAYEKEMAKELKAIRDRIKEIESK